MSWVSPRTWTTGEIVSAAMMNGLRDALLETAAAKVTTAGDLTYATGANALGRLAAVAAGQVLTSQGVGVAPAWAAGFSADVLPWVIEIDPLSRGATHVNWSTFVSTSGAHGGYLHTDTGAQNNEITWPVVLAAGTWTIRLTVDTTTDSGIYSVQFDGVTKMTADGYSAGGANSAFFETTGVAVAATGKVTLKVLMATKNASSSAYNGYLRHVKLVRTA